MKISCQQCAGRGVITTMAPAPIKGCKLTSSVHRAPQNRFCSACQGTGKVDAPPTVRRTRLELALLGLDGPEVA